MQQLVMTAVGNDRPGLVDEVSGFLLEQGANVADTRMVNLSGQFAMLILAHCSDAAAQKVRDGAVRFGASVGLNIQVAEPGPADVVRSTGLPFKLRTYAMDQPGIVHRVTAALHKHGVNIEELQTRLTSASVSGTPLFTMDMTLTIPANLAVRKLRAELETLCESLNCDMDLTPAG